MASFPVNHVPLLLLHLAILVIFFSFSLVEVEAQNRLDAQNIVPEDGKGDFDGLKGIAGSFGDWQMWTRGDYQVNDQCYPSDRTALKDLLSYRLLFYCTKDCDKAELIVCYPSMLDPDAFPDEKDGQNPMRRAYKSKWITNDPDHEITKNCTHLMEDCLADKNCKKSMPKMAQEYGEKWHGIKVSRHLEGKERFFRITLPYGSIKGKIFKILDDDRVEQFYINFGNPGKAEITEIWRGNSSIYNPYIEKSLVNSKPNKHCFDEFSAKAKEGMPLDAAAHIWNLGLDILPDEENQQVRFYTRGFPSALGGGNCVKNITVGGLQAGRTTDNGYISAKFLKPATRDPDGFLSGGTGNSAGGTSHGINVRGKPVLYELKKDHYNTQFYVHFKVLDKPSNFTITLIKGNMGNKLSVEALKLYVTYQNGTFGSCSLKIDNGISSISEDCKPANLAAGFSYYLWLNTQNSNISINCNNFHKAEKGGIKIPYSTDSTFQFQGDIELLAEGGNSMVEETTPVKIGEMTPVLEEWEIPGGQFSKGNYLVIESATADKGDKDKLEMNIRMVSNDGTIFEMRFTIKTDARCAGIENCFSCKDCEGKIVSFIIFYREDNKCLLYLNGENSLSSVNSISGNAKRIQINGDIQFPIEMDNFGKQETQFFVQKSSSIQLYGSVIFQLLILDDGDEFAIKFLGTNTESFPDKKERSMLEFNFNLKEPKASASFFEIDFGNYKHIPMPLNNAEYDPKQTTFPLERGKIVWLKVYFGGDFSDPNAKSVTCKMAVNNNAFLDFNIPLKEKAYNMDVNEIMVEKAVLLNKLLTLPDRIEFGKDPRVSKEHRISVTGRILPNAKNVHFILAQRKENSAGSEFLGTDFMKQQESKLKNTDIFLHIKVFPKQDRLYVCFSDTLDKSSECASKQQPNLFTFKEKFTLTITINKLKPDNQVQLELWKQDSKEPIILDGELPQNVKKGGAKANFFVIGGDIALDAKPELSEIGLS